MHPCVLQELDAAFLHSLKERRVGKVEYRTSPLEALHYQAFRMCKRLGMQISWLSH